jgi:hypothetical protein
MTNVTSRSLLVACAISGALAVPASASAASKFFHSPTGNIECQLSTGKASGTSAYCETIQPARSATLRATGKTTVCRGEKCLGNGPENAFSLRYGHSTTLGIFRCSSSTTGIRCIVASSGHGFRISRGGVVRF